MEQTELFENKTQKSERKYIRSRNDNKSFTPTIDDPDFCKRFDAYCRRTGKNKTKVVMEWLSERLAEEEEDEINQMSIEDLRRELKALRGKK